MSVLPDEADRGAGLKRESRYGLAVQFGLAVLATAVLGWLNALDVSTLPGWAAGAVALGVSGLAGALTAYRTKNLQTVAVDKR